MSCPGRLTRRSRPGLPGLAGLGAAAAWISAVCCLPYLVLKVAWTAGAPVGITDRSVLHSHGWAAANALMAAIELAGLLLVLALTRPWARRLPTWLLLFPVWMGTGLLFRVVVGTALLGLFARPSQASGSLGGFQPWVFVMVYASFAGQGAALAIAFACYVRARWGRLLGERTGEVAARRAARARSWPEDHLAEMAGAVSGLAVAAVAVFCYWAADGSFGLSAAQPHPSWALQASRAAGAVIAVAGLLGLACRWGHQTRFWLPVALAWVGSGSLAAFDGLELDAQPTLPHVRDRRLRIGLEPGRHSAGDRGGDRGVVRCCGRPGAHSSRQGRPASRTAGLEEDRPGDRSDRRREP